MQILFILSSVRMVAILDRLNVLVLAFAQALIPIFWIAILFGMLIYAFSVLAVFAFGLNPELRVNAKRRVRAH